MKREIRREVHLPQFSIGLAELELLWIRLQPLFANVDGTSFYIDIEFEDEKLTFDSLEELKTAAFPKENSTNFTLHCHGSSCSVHLYTSLHAGSQPRLVVTSDSEVWAAGAREVVLTVVNQNRVWYHWLRPNLMVQFLLLGMVGSTFTLVLVQALKLSVDRLTVIGVAGTLLVLTLLFFGGRLLPMATLRLSRKEAFWRRYSVELTLALALLSALLTAYGLFVPKSGG